MIINIKRILLLAFVQSIGLIVFSQNPKDLIKKDHILIDLTFNDQVFLNLVEIAESTAKFKIISIDTFSGYLEKANQRVEFFEILKVSIKMNEASMVNLPVGVKGKVKDDILDYYVLVIDSKKFKLFGFYTTDILLFMDQFGTNAFIKVKEQLITSKILTKKEAKLFEKDVLKLSRMYNWKINKPCAILKYYFREDEISKAGTILLPVQPLKPFNF